MNKVFRSIAFVLVAVLLLSALSACGNNGIGDGKNSTIYVDEAPSTVAGENDKTEKNNPKKDKKNKETTSATKPYNSETQKKPVGEQGAATKTFEANGLSIRLPELFKANTVPNTVAYFENEQDNIAIGVRKQAFNDEWNAQSPLSSYISQYSKQYNVPSSASAPQKRENYSFITYDNAVDEFTYFCITGFWYGSDGIWSVTFICGKQYEDDLKSQMLTWADTVKVK